MRVILYWLGLALLAIPLLVPWMEGSGTQWVESHYGPLDPHVWHAIDALPMLSGVLLGAIRSNNRDVLYPSLALDLAVLGLFVLGGLGTGLALRRLRGRADWAGITRVTAALFLLGSWLAAACICALRRFGFGETVGSRVEITPLAGFWLAAGGLIVAGGLFFLASKMRGSPKYAVRSVGS